MDLIHKFLNMVLPLLTVVSIFLFLPPYFIFKVLSFIKRSMFRENLAGKVVLITGASSGIGEQLAYEYARRGARLALAARREDRLRVVADKARKLGSPDVLLTRTDVSDVEDCRRFVDKAVSHFGRLDHLVSNAGIINQAVLVEDCTLVPDLASIMDVNFWGSAYCTHFAIPHLKQNKGKIVVIASAAAWSPLAGISFYNASKAALVNFYETLRVECGSHIGITIVTPGLIDSEMTTTDDFKSKVHARNFPPAESAEGCAKAIVKSACRGDTYLTEPGWMRVGFLLKVLYPELNEWFYRWYYKNGPRKCHQRKIRH